MRPLPALSLLSLLAACRPSSDQPHFRSGGTADTGIGGGGGGSADTGGPGDTGRPGDTADTGAPPDTGDTGAAFQGTGYAEGDTAYELRAPDQQGREWSLYAHAGSPVLLVFGSAWDTDFQYVSSYLQDLVDGYPGLQAVCVLRQDAYHFVPEQDDAADWASTYGLETVLYDEDDSLGDWAPYSQLRLYAIRGDMRIEWVGSTRLEREQLAEHLDELAAP